MMVSFTALANFKYNQIKDHSEKFKAIKSIKIKSTIGNSENNEPIISITICNFPSELHYSIKRLNNVILTIEDKFRKSFKEEYYMWASYIGEICSDIYLEIQTENSKDNIVIFPEYTQKFANKVKRKLECVFNRFHRNAKLIYANKLKKKAIDATSLYLKGV